MSKTKWLANGSSYLYKCLKSSRIDLGALNYSRIGSADTVPFKVINKTPFNLEETI